MLRVYTWNYRLLCGEYFIYFADAALRERTLIQTEYVNLMRKVGQRMDALFLCG